MRQQGEGIRTSMVVPQGGTIEVDVGPNDATVEIKDGNPSNSATFKVEPGKRASIPVPPVPGGTVLTVSVGSGARARTILVEVVSSFG